MAQLKSNNAPRASQSGFHGLTSGIPIVMQPLVKSFGLGGIYALTGGLLTIVALDFALFRSQVRNLVCDEAG